MKLEIILVEFIEDSWMGLMVEEEACLFGMALEEEDLSPSFSFLPFPLEDAVFSNKNNRYLNKHIGRKSLLWALSFIIKWG
ncbi:hypothetical protein [Neobacillus drentensis]|uniref:hypothetical protein n=1 Tax=Neobacillus drentensis TaxID=220684 RepID=UPI000827060B|nr:hypothetical protein [Neobacillus drentensis]